MKKTKKWLWPVIAIGIILVAVIAGMVIPKETHPSADTRIILEHTHQTYIAPVCFEDADPTNFLEEATLEKAEDLNYPPHSTCTEQALESEDDRLLTSWLKDLGIMKKTWDEW